MHLSDAFIDSTVTKTKSTWWEKWLEVSSVIAVNLITLEIFIIIFWLIIFWNNRIYSYLLVFASPAIMLVARASKIKYIKNFNRRHAQRCRTAQRKAAISVHFFID